MHFNGSKFQVLNQISKQSTAVKFSPFKFVNSKPVKLNFIDFEIENFLINILASEIFSGKALTV